MFERHIHIATRKAHREMIKALIPLALAMLTLNACTDAQSADTAAEGLAAKETVTQLARAAASEDSTGTRTGHGLLSGIREDVASYIQRTYPLPYLMPHMLDMARALELSMHVDLSDKEQVRKVARQYSLALGCVYEVTGKNPSSPHPALIAETVAAATFNTRERRSAEVAYSKAASGLAIPALETACQAD